MHATSRQCGKARTTSAQNLDRHDADSLVGTGYRKQPPKSVDRILHVRWQRLPDPQYRLVEIKVEAVQYRALRAGEKAVREPRSDCSMGRRFEVYAWTGNQIPKQAYLRYLQRGVNVRPCAYLRESTVLSGLGACTTFQDTKFV